MAKNTKTLEDHKKISPVAPSANKNLSGAAIIVLAVIGIIYMVINKDTKVIEKKEENFNPAYSVDNDFTKRIEKIENEQKRKKKLRKDDLSPAQAELMRKLIAEKNKMAAEAENKARLAALEETKRKSKMMIYSHKSKTQSTEPFDNSSSISLAGLSQLNQNKQEKESKYADIPDPEILEVTQVSQIANLDRTLTAGKFIAGVLETAIDSTLAGQLRAVVSTNVYSENGSSVLVEKGTRLIGEYQSGIAQGQNRIYVIWNTAITPNGFQIPLSSIGTNQLGVSGLAGDYDSHFVKKFGAALLLSIIENQSQSDNQLTISSQDSLSNASSVALNSSINIPPTIYVDQGEKINIFVARNIVF